MARLQRHEERVATCAPVWHELVFGVRRLAGGRCKKALRQYLEGVLRPNLVVLPYVMAY